MWIALGDGEEIITTSRLNIEDKLIELCTGDSTGMAQSTMGVRVVPERTNT